MLIMMIFLQNWIESLFQASRIIRILVDQKFAPMCKFLFGGIGRIKPIMIELTSVIIHNKCELKMMSFFQALAS